MIMAKQPINLALVGAGRIGSFHAETVVNRLVDTHLVAIADPAPGAADRLADKLECPLATTDVDAVLADSSVDGVLITTPARFHAGLVEKAALAGKAVFCEKPMALSLDEADKAIAAANDANVVLQVGFNRRWDQSFAEANAAIKDGKVGAPQLLRSLTRDPGPYSGDPSKTPLWTIFFETLIHDFDTLLWLNAGAKPVEVYAIADALVRPDFKDQGFLDTAVVTIRFDNGAVATADANFSALYGYDVRGEVFGSKGMVTMGDVRRSNMNYFGAGGVNQDTWRLDADHFLWGYTAQLSSFVNAIKTGKVEGAGGQDARASLKVELACIESVQKQKPNSLE
jgi:myo-inositol 2-dehydrogenase/D-chiro-inositol 1-dehydrogenase